MKATRYRKPSGQGIGNHPDTCVEFKGKSDMAQMTYFVPVGLKT